VGCAVDPPTPLKLSVQKTGKAMIPIKDIFDLITQLRDKIEDRKIVSELLQIQAHIDFLHSECLQAKERALNYRTQLSELNEEKIELKREIRDLKDAHRKQIADINMMHRIEIAGADDAREMVMEDLKQVHSKEIEEIKRKK